MPNARLVVGMLPLVVSIAGATAACAQNFPSRPLRILTGGAGGGNDIAARLIARGLTNSWGQQVVVDNRASGIIPGEIVAKAQPDGYTMVLSGSSFWISPLFLDKPPYDAVRDFSPVTLPVRAPNVLVVTSSLPVKSVKELIALAKAKPGELNYVTTGTGSAPHLGGELFKAMANINIVRVNYKGTGEGVNDLIAGRVQLMFPNVSSGMPHVRSGRLRALAVTSAQPSPLVADLPTVAATGLPGYELVSPFGVFAPAGTPAAVIKILNLEIGRVLGAAESKNLLANTGLETVASSPQELATMVKSEIAKWSRLIKDAGIRASSALSPHFVPGSLEY